MKISYPLLTQKLIRKLLIIAFIAPSITWISMPIAQAQESDSTMITLDESHLNFTLDKITLEKVEVLSSEENPYDFAPLNIRVTGPQGNTLDRAAGGGESTPSGESPVSVAEGFIVLGQKLWKFIEDNQPQVSTQGAYAHIVPNQVQSWEELERWDRPVSAVYRASYKNLYGIEVVNLAFRVTFTPRGSYQNRGQYIANLVVLPEVVDVAWGYKVNAGAKIYEVLNRGDQEDPIAAAQISVGWTVSTVLKESTTNYSLFVEGDGSLTDLSAP